MSKKRGVYNRGISFLGVGILSVILLSLLLFIIPSIMGGVIDERPPAIDFTDPTPADGEKREERYADIRINITEEDLSTFIWNWNGTNYTFYYDSLVLMLNFDNIAELGENEGYVKDLSRYGNDGTVYGASYTEGKLDSGLEFKNKNDYVVIAEDSSLDLEVFSVEFWFKPDKDYGPGSNHMSFVYDEDYGIYMEDGKMVFEHMGNKVSSSTNEWEKDRWYHILATYDGVQTIYVNYVKEDSVILAAPFSLKDNAGRDAAFFLNSGDIILRGNCNSGACSYSADDLFVVQNLESETVAIIDNNGNLCIEDSDCNDKDKGCGEPDAGFILKNTHDEVVSYIDSDGGLCLIGNLIENGIS